MTSVVVVVEVVVIVEVVFVDVEVVVEVAFVLVVVVVMVGFVSLCKMPEGLNAPSTHSTKF